MKRFLSILLVFSLLLSVSFGLAEENTSSVKDSGYPYIPFGMDMSAAFSYINQYMSSSGIHFDDSSPKELVALSDGTQFFVVTAFTETGYGYTAEEKLYFTASDRKLVAGVFDYGFQNGQKLEMIRDQIVNAFGFGEPLKLTLASLGDKVELVRETAHLEDGLDAWYYTAHLQLQLTEKPIDINAVMILSFADNHAYITAWPLGQASQQGAAGNVPGTAETVGSAEYDKLTEEQKKLADLYAEFLEKEKQEKLNQFIRFLLTKQ